MRGKRGAWHALKVCGCESNCWCCGHVACAPANLFSNYTFDQISTQVGTKIQHICIVFLDSIDFNFTLALNTNGYYWTEWWAQDWPKHFKLLLPSVLTVFNVCFFTSFSVGLLSGVWLVVMDCVLDRSLLHIPWTAAGSQPAAHLLHHPAGSRHDHGEDVHLKTVA